MGFLHIIPNDFTRFFFFLKFAFFGELSKNRVFERLGGSDQEPFFELSENSVFTHFDEKRDCSITRQILRISRKKNCVKISCHYA